MDEGLDHVAPAGGGEISTVSPLEWRVQELKKRHLRIDRGDDSPGWDALVGVCDHSGDAFPARLDPVHTRVAAQPAPELVQPRDERIGERLRATARVPLAEEVVG